MTAPQGGTNWSDIINIAGQVLNAGSQFYGASAQSDTNAANLAYLQQHNAMMQGYVNQLFQQGPSPFAQAYMGMMGSMHAPTQQQYGMQTGNGIGGAPVMQTYPGYNGPAAASQPYGGAGPSNTGGAGPIGNPQGLTPPDTGGGMRPTGGWTLPYNPQGQQPNPYAPTDTGGMYAGGAPIPMNPAGMNPLTNPIPNQGGLVLGPGMNPLTNPIPNQGGLVLGPGMTPRYSMMANPSGLSLGGVSGMPAQLTLGLGGVAPGLPSGNGGLPSGVSPFGLPPTVPGTRPQLPQTPTGTSTGTTSNPSDPFGPAPTPSGQWPAGVTPRAAPSMLNVPTGNTSTLGALSVPGLASYGSIAPQTYAASTLGAAPRISGIPQVQGATVDAAQIAGINPYQAQQIDFNALPKVNAQTIGNLPTVNTQGYNTAQDGLMQAARANIQAPDSGNLLPNMNKMSSTGNMFDPSGMLDALKQTQGIDLNKQVSALRASAGDLGQRFGTAMNNNEAMLRTNLGAQYNLANQGVMQSTYENAQNRALSSLGTQANYQTGLNQLPFQNAQLQQSALNAAGSQFLTGQGQNLQAQTQNQNTSLAAQQANATYGMTAQQANLQANLAAQTSNQSSGLQAGLAGQSLQEQIAAQNAAAQQQAAMQNAQYNMQAQLANQSMGFATQQANAGYQAQYGLANQGALNNASQFNAQSQYQAAGFNSQQNQLYNNTMMNLMGQGQGAYTQQNQYNAGLVGILGGLAVPQQQPSPWPSAIANVGNTLSTIPIMQQFLNQPQH